jgi:phytoene dehydrogenase-like protein
MIDFMAALPTSGLAPSGHYLVQAYIICTPEEAKSKQIVTYLKDLLDANLKRLMPGYPTQVRWAMYPSIWHLDGVAKTIDNEKPDIKTPIQGLYLVGDCVKAPGIGVNCALSSAKIMRDILVGS